MPEALDKLIDTARLCGWALLAFCVLMVGIAVAGPVEYQVEQTRFVVAMLVGHALPGVAFLALAWWMSRGRPMAFMVTTAFTVFCLAKTFVGMAMLCAGAETMAAIAMALPLCAPIQVLVLAYVGGRCLIAWPEVRHLWKAAARRRAYAENAATVGQLPGGSAASTAIPTNVTARPPIPPPPPRARSVRARTRPLDNDQS
jgi:hypothetical protein